MTRKLNSPLAHSTDQSRYFNRELSWLEFNARVLEEAKLPSTPLLERVRFMSIFASNLDEFFMVRVAGKRRTVREGLTTSDSPDRTPGNEVIAAIQKRSSELQKDLYDNWQNTLVPALSQHNIGFKRFGELTKSQQTDLNRYFTDEIFPVLTPLGVDPAHPFPFLVNLRLYLLVTFKATSTNSDQPAVSFVEVPTVVPRLTRIKQTDSKEYAFLFLEELIQQNLPDLFFGLEIENVYQVRVTRDLDFTLLENEVVDLLKSIQNNIKAREQAPVIRLEVSHDLPDHLRDFLANELMIDTNDIYRCPGPLALDDLKQLCDLPLETLKFEPFNPRLPPDLRGNRSIFSILQDDNLLLHHPYESFYTVIEFLSAAANDPRVVAIKQTLYRVSGAHSPIVDALILAAENGKQVTVVVELKARFDEKNNITWARRMERSGINVVYGFVGLKTHAKIALVVRREDTGVKRYFHLSTGNYNWVTAKLYEDIGFMSSDDELGQDISELFNLLTGFNLFSEERIFHGAALPKFRKIFISPLNLRDSLLGLIQREIDHARQGVPGRIIAKMNSLVDKTLIDKLYEASQVGVEIELLVRGICCLRPQVPGMSDHIRVRSIVDRFLEHSRIYYFENNGHPETFLSSADWMPRNLDRRIEIMFPLTDAATQHRLLHDILETYLEDNVKTRILTAEGQNEYLTPTDPDVPMVRAQQRFIEIARQQGLKSLPYEKAVRHNPKLLGRPILKPNWPGKTLQEKETKQKKKGSRHQKASE
jgi:polyphosphate kinase